MAFNEAPDISRAATCCGSASLTELLSSFARKTKGDAALKVGVVGKSHQKAIHYLLFAACVCNK